MHRHEWFYDGCAADRSLAELVSCYAVHSTTTMRGGLVYRVDWFTTAAPPIAAFGSGYRDFVRP